MERGHYKVLVVDDHSLSRKLLMIQLANFGFAEGNIAECHSGALALEVLKGKSYDLAVIDWDMPEMDGLELIEQCRENDIKTAFVMVSAEAQPERILHAINRGAASYITKPVSQCDINEKIAKVMEWMAARSQK